MDRFLAGLVGPCPRKNIEIHRLTLAPRFVALVDKGSIIVTLLLSFLILREHFSAQTLAGTALILAGIVVLNWKL